MKSIMQAAAFGIMAMLMSVSVIAPTWACTPLIVFVKGLSDGDKRMGRIYEEEDAHWRARGVKTGVVDWGDLSGSNEEEVENMVIRHKRRYGEGAPVVLVGYSYGGDTAYLAADGLWDDDIEAGKRIMLVTLDAVGERAFYECSDLFGWCFGMDRVFSWRDDGLKKPHGGPWINVFTENSPGSGGWRVASGCDGVHRIGGLYGNQTKATKNYHVPGSHCAVNAFYSRAKPDIDNYIERECRR